MYANKIKRDQVQSSKIVENEYYDYLKELFESYAINPKKHVAINSVKDSNKLEQQKLIREALMKGYVEMSQINLTICLESQYAEYEAQHTTERLVSGG